MKEKDIDKMVKKEIKIVLAIFTFISVVLLITVLFFGYMFARNIINAVKLPEKYQERLLCDTNFIELKEACIELLERVESGQLAPRRYYIRKNPSPQISNFPEVILKLDPYYVYISDEGRIRVVMASGLAFVGVTFYSEAYDNTNTNYPYGNKELLPGLWYFNTDDEIPRFDKQVDELIQKNKYLHEYGEYLKDN